ncbi:hypothetical protein K4F52_005044 [Lecanicillium sp. MT-2017a]|nr:hypothetical protein K4F52_005044 [Lecanicillium sp. MT-2017a]
MPSKRKYTVYVVVFKGDPVDFIKYRHTGLWFVPEDGGTQHYFHVTGLTGQFQFESRKGFDPTKSRTFAKKVKVGKIKLSLTSSEIGNLLESVSVNNYDLEFNCQQWVQDALSILLDAGYINEEQYNNGLDGMTDAIAEAADEDFA